LTINSRHQYAAGTLFLLSTVVIWGLQFPIAKDAFESVNAFHSAVFRFGLPAITMIIVLLLTEGRQAFQPDKEVLAVAALGLLGMCATPSLIFGGLMFTRPEIAAMVVASQPILSVVVQRFWHKEKTSLLSLFCVFLAFTGILTVITRWDLSLQITAGEMFGNLMVLLGALCWVVYTIACGKYTHWNTVRLTAWTLTTGSLGNVLVVVVLVTAGLITHPSGEQWYEVRYELLFLALIGVLVAMSGWNAGVRLLGAINAMLFINLIPIVTITFRYLQGYRFTWIELFGAVLVIVALLTQNLALRRKMMRQGN